MQSAMVRPGKTAGALMLVGGALAAIGTQLDWFTARADLTSLGESVQTQVAKGSDTSDGKIFVWVALGLVAAGLVLLVLKARPSRLALSLIAIAASAFVGGFGLYDALTPKAQAIDEAASRLGGGAAVRSLLERLFDQGILTISVEVGLWLVVAGGAVALVGAIAGAASRTKPVAVGVGTGFGPQGVEPAIGADAVPPAPPTSSGTAAPPPMPGPTPSPEAPPAPDLPPPGPGGYEPR
jgi:hypothetical protein